MAAVWIVLTLALVMVLPSLPWRSTVEHLGRIEPAWMAASVLANLMILPLWAVEWRLLVPGGVRIATGRAFEIVSVTASVLNSVPFLAGEASAVALLMGRAGLSRGAAFAVLAMDQLLVGFAKVAVLVAAATYAPLPDWLRAGLLSLGLGVAALLMILLPLAHRGTPIHDRLLLRPSRLRRLAARVATWGAQLDVLRDAGRIWRVALLALAKKGVELAGIVAVQMAFGMEPSVAAALLVLAALAVTTLLPMAPANLGVYEATVFATYRYLGVPAEAALGIAFVQHLSFLLPALCTGYVTLTLRQLLPRRLPVA